MAMDPIQQSPFVYYPQVAATGGDISKSFSSGYTAEQQHAANALAMDAARQTEVMNQQSMRLKDTEEARKQALFKQGMADRARIASLAATPLDTSLPGNAPPVGAPSGGSGDAVLPPTTQPFAGGVSAGTESYRSAPAAPAPAAPGPRAEYEPSSQKPDWYNPQPRTAGLAGPQFAQNTTQINDAQGGGYTPTPAPAAPGAPPAMPQAVLDKLNMSQEAFNNYMTKGTAQDRANILAAISRISTEAATGVGDAITNAINTIIERSSSVNNPYAAKVAAWYQRPDVQDALRNTPGLLDEALTNSGAVYERLNGALGNQAFPQGTSAGTETYRGERAYSNTAPVEANYPITLPATKPGVAEGGVSTNKDVAANIESSKTVQPAINLQGAFEGFDTVQQNRKLDVSIALYKKQYEMAMKARDFATAREMQVKTTEAVLAKEQLSYMGLIHQFQNDNYAPLANALNAQSKQFGGDLKIQPRWDGKFNLFNGDKLVSGEEGYTKDQLILASRQKFDDSYKAQIANLQAIELASKKEAAIANAKVPAAATTHALNAEADLRAAVAKDKIKFGMDMTIKQMEFANEAEKAAALAASNRLLKQYESTLPKGQKIIESKEVPGVFIRYDEVGGGATTAFKLVPKINPATNKPFMETDGKTPQLEMVEIGK